MFAEQVSLIARIRRKIYKIFHPSLGEVWMLHSVCKECKPILNDKKHEISDKDLETAIQNKIKKGYKFISLDELADIYQGAPIKTKFVCITLDDGYENNYSVAYPIFKKYSCPFAIAIATGLCEGSVKPWWCDNVKFLSIEQIKKLSQNHLCTISAHTVSHPRLNTLSYDEQKKEITESIKQLEQITGKRIEHFAYPHGDCNADTLKILTDLKIKTSVLANGGYVRKRQHCLQIPRLLWNRLS